MSKPTNVIREIVPLDDKTAEEIDNYFSKAGRDFRSELSLEVGVKGYHNEVFEEGPYPVNPEA